MRHFFLQLTTIAILVSGTFSQDREPEAEEPDIEEFVGLLTEEAKGAKLFTLFSLNIYKCIFIVFSCA